MRLLSHTLTALSFLLLLVGLTGCGVSGSKVTGKVVKSGTPVTVGDKGVITMMFIQADDKAGAAPYSVSTKTDGSFEVAGRGDVKGIVPGKYRVTVEAYDPYPGKDKFNGKYNRENSKVMMDVTGAGEITVDLDKDGAP